MREIIEDDAEVIVSWRSQPQVYQYFRNPHALTLKEHLQWFRNVYSGNDMLASWIYINQNLPAGIAGIKREDDVKAELSYLTACDFQRQGYAKEAVEAVMKWSREMWGILCFKAEVHRENTASQIFIQSLGFTYYKENGYFNIYICEEK